MNFKPVQDRVLLKVKESDNKTAGGIIIPDANKKKSIEAEVMAVGFNVCPKTGDKMPLSVKKGDKVFFCRFSGAEINIDNEDYTIVKETDILGIMEG